MSTIEHLSNGSSDKNTVTVAHTGLAEPLTGVQRITCALEPAGITVDSDIHTGVISWDTQQITFQLGRLSDHGLSQPVGHQSATLKAYDDGEWVYGQTLAFAEDDELVFEFVA